MPWSTMTIEDEKISFVADVLEEDDTFSSTCAQHGISRKTGYKWLERYRAEGFDGLKERSRAPRSNANAIPAEVVTEIVRVREKHPTWGPRKVLARLEVISPALSLPSESSTYNILKRYGLIRSRRRGKAKFDRQDRQLTIAKGPNELWAADYKGQIFTRRDRYVFPLTVTDLFSRYLLRCHALRTTAHEPAKKQFERLFAEYGLPRMIRTDNGSPFATPAPCGLSRLSIWWLKLGILHERIDPGRPQQNGSHERMHRTLKAETAKPPGPSLVAQQRRFDAFVEVFNNERPHEAIGMKTPSCLYSSSGRAMPRCTPAFEYDSGIEIRRVHQSGRIRFKNGSLILLGRALAGEDVALKEAEDGIWQVYLGPLLLGALDERCFDVGLIRLSPPVRRSNRRRWR